MVPLGTHHFSGCTICDLIWLLPINDYLQYLLPPDCLAYASEPAFIENAAGVKPP